MRGLLLGLIVAVLLQGFGATEVRPQAPQEPLSVSLVQLIANPERYGGQRVSVIGFYRMDRHGDLLFLHEEDDRHLLGANSIRVAGTREMWKEMEKLDGKYVKITGVFQPTDRQKEPLAFFSGTITEVHAFRLWSDPRKPLGAKIREHPGKER